MNISKKILLGSFIGLAFVSCANEGFPTSEEGTMTLCVEKVVPAATRTVETADFPVAVYSLNTNQVIASYKRADEVPSKIKMNTGEYYAEAHSPLQLKKIMSDPYYVGCDTFEILQNINTISNVICRMANGSITLRFSDDFMTVFKSWTVTIDDGSETAIVYTYDQDGLFPATKYIRFEENVKELNVQFFGVTIKGNRITTANILTKRQASEQYDSDNEYFSGGDVIVVNFSPVDATDGDVTGISITANIQFEESEDNFTLEVEDDIFAGGGNNGDEENPSGGDSDAITLNLPADMVVSNVTDPALGDTYIAAEHGIKSIRVKMSSTSEDMMSSLTDLSGNYDGVDFATGAEVVENQNMVALFSDLGQTLSVPSEGDLAYTFPIGNFFTLLSVLPGEHSFTLTIIDMQGGIKNGKLKLTVE